MSKIRGGQDEIHVAKDERSPKTCAYCHHHLTEGQTAVICRECGTVHHKECWEENRGCAAFPCDCQPHTILRTATSIEVDVVQIAEQVLFEIPSVSADIVIDEDELSAQTPDLVIEEGELKREKRIAVDPADLAPLPTPQIFCTYCHNSIEINHQAVSCSKCNAPHHLVCWNDIGGCATMGCQSKQYTIYRVGQQTSPDTAFNPDGNNPRDGTIKDRFLQFLHSLRK